MLEYTNHSTLENGTLTTDRQVEDDSSSLLGARHVAYLDSEPVLHQETDGIDAIFIAYRLDSRTTHTVPAGWKSAHDMLEGVHKQIE